jgi:hypothetical protein
MAYASGSNLNPLANYWLNGRFVMPGAPDNPPAQPGAASAPVAPQNTWGPGGFQIPDSVTNAVSASGGTTMRRPPGTLTGGNASNDPSILNGGQPEKKYIPSLSAALTGSDHSPSLYQAIDSGTVKDPDWWLEGGPGVLSSLTTGGTNRISQALGLGKMTDTVGRLFGIQKKRTDATDIWGTAAKNAAAASKFDYTDYGNSTGLKDAYEKAIADTSPQGQKDLRFQEASYDVNGDKKLSLGEFVQWWAEQTPEGRAAMANGDFKPSTQSTIGGAVPTFADLQAARAAQQDGNPIIGAINSQTQPINDPIDPEKLKRLFAQ